MTDTTTTESTEVKRANVICIDRGRLRARKPQKPEVRARRKEKETLAKMALGLAPQACAYCFGIGQRPGCAGGSTICNCVFREIFRACYRRFQSVAGETGAIGQVHYDNVGPGAHNPSARWSMKGAEFAADFVLVVFRALHGGRTRLQVENAGEQPSAAWKIFTLHFLLGGDWKVCCRKLGMTRGNFFHAVYRIEEIAGAAFARTEPFALFPVDEYFSGGRNLAPAAGDCAKAA